MLRKLDHRLGHYVLLALVWALASLPNLGGPTLWDIDEGLNAEAAREMLDSGNYVVPTFNYKLRSAKPVLLYWLQVASYRAFGVSEAAARLPSALAALLAVIGVYELGRWLYGLRTALLAGLILATSIGVLGAAHFANPDALLLATSTWTMACFYRWWQMKQAGWLYLSAIACGLAVLAKGPVGLLLPGAVVVGFLLWQREPRRLLDWRLAEAVGLFLLVAVPWFVWVGVETKGQFLREFWFTHHLDRVATPMEKHSGSPAYYLGVLVIGLLPWTCFLGLTIVATWRQLGRGWLTELAATRFLVVWFGVWLVAFSVAKTKLPNYVLPLYPAAALLTARALERWRAGEAVPGWWIRTALGCLAFVGVVSGAIMVAGGGLVESPMPASWRFPELAKWAWLGLVPVATAGVGLWLLARERRTAMLATVVGGGLVFVAGIAGGALEATNLRKPTALLAKALPADQEYRDIRLGAYRYDRPTLVFYCRREVRRLDEVADLAAYLHEALPVYVFMQESRWKEVEKKVPKGTTVIAAHPDLYVNGEPVVVVTNADRVRVAERQR